jgi:hypothetical protein
MGWFRLVLQNHIAEGGEDQRRGLSGDAGEGQHAAGDDARRGGFTVIESTERQLGTPRARAASRTAWGTISSISSVVRQTVGIIMMPSATPPEKAEKCPLRNAR